MYSQVSELAYLHDNYSNLLPQRMYSTDAGKKYNTEKDYVHPDFGKLTQDAPFGKHVVEVLAKRKPDERYYIDLDNPLFFYIEKAAKPINFYKNGYLVAIDPSFYFSANGIYRAENQPCPTVLNTVTKTSAIMLGNEKIEFNDFSLKVVKNDNSVRMYSSDWSNITVGNNGAYIINVFPGIDMKIMYREAAIKSEFIIKQPLNAKQIVFTDHLKLSAGFSLQNEVPMQTDHTKGHILVMDSYGQLVAQIDPPRSHDNSGSHTSWINTTSLNGTVFEIVCDSLMLNSHQTVYPVTVDPLVTAVGPITSGTTYLAGTQVSPAFCSTSISVTYPAGTTPWDVSAYWSMYSNWCYGYYTGHGPFADDCWMSEAQVWITSSCGGRSPTGTSVWICNACNSPGTWSPTLPYASSGSQSLAQCYAASCSARTMTFTINQNRLNCTAYLNYDGCSPVSRSYCQTLDNWRVTVQGRSLETLGNTTTGNGTTTVTPVCFTTATINPSAQYGVGPYSYNWNPGGQTTASKTVFANYVGTQTYTCSVTDACGTARTAVFNVTPNCVLPVELLYFTGVSDTRYVLLNWATASERNASYFTIERSYDGVNFTLVTKIDAFGNSSEKRTYQATDTQMDLGKIIYYRLKQFDEGVEKEVYSSVIDIEPLEHKSVSVFPNPGSGIYHLIPDEANSDNSYSLKVHDYTGKEIVNMAALKRETTIDLSSFPAGIYSLQILIGDKQIIKNIVKQ